MAGFVLDEQKLREEFANDDGGWIEPFDPIKVDADQLHRVVDACLEREVIARPNPRAWLAVYPLSISEPEPLLSVNPGEGPLLLGDSVVFDVGDERGDQVEESIVVLRALVDAANALYAESAAGKMGVRGGAGERCESCLRVHGPVHACLVGVLAGCVDAREYIEPPTAGSSPRSKSTPSGMRWVARPWITWKRGFARPAPAGSDAVVVSASTASRVD